MDESLNDVQSWCDDGEEGVVNRDMSSFCSGKTPTHPSLFQPLHALAQCDFPDGSVFLYYALRVPEDGLSIALSLGHFHTMVSRNSVDPCFLPVERTALCLHAWCAAQRIKPRACSRPGHQGVLGTGKRPASGIPKSKLVG